MTGFMSSRLDYATIRSSLVSGFVSLDLLERVLGCLITLTGLGLARSGFERGDLAQVGLAASALVIGAVLISDAVLEAG